MIGLALFAALVGYLPFNFPPARIFLGDTGSLFIGFGLGAGQLALSLAPSWGIAVHPPPPSKVQPW